MLRKYFWAMAVLYSIIPLFKACEMIQDQNPGLVSKKEFLAFAEIAAYEHDHYVILGTDALYTDAKPTADGPRNYLPAHDCLSSIYEGIKTAQQGKPYCIPSKEELLLYAKKGCCEQTVQTETLKKFIAKTSRLDDKQVALAFQSMVDDERLGFSFDAPIQFLEELGSSFRSKKNFLRYMNLYSDFCNHLRLPHNRGYTPTEIRQMMPDNAVPQSPESDSSRKKYLADGTLSADQVMQSINVLNLPQDALRRFVTQ